MFQGVSGPGAILAGSCSSATLQQIDLHRRDHPALAVDGEAVMARKVNVEDLVSFVRVHQGEEPLVYSSATHEVTNALQKRFGREAVSRHLETLFAEVARRLVESGVCRLVVAGGETSGAIVSALNLSALAIGPEIDPGVPALTSIGDRPLALALKSGNFGAQDFFSRALRTLETCA
jgi:uncharacterized protein YgbK (DUF1537 family)